jgi:branched-chain amino acid transport system permease protein
VNLAMQFYLTTLLVFLGVNVLACWGLNLQFGVAGVINFAFVVFQAIGAYTTAVLSMGPDTAYGGFQHYILGNKLPFPLPLLIGTAVGALLGLLLGMIGLRRLRSDYEAMVMLVVSVIATKFVTSDTGLLNGPAGLALIPHPLASTLGLAPIDYAWFYVGLVAVSCALCYVVVHRITNSPYGRMLRAMRENERAAVALGKNVAAMRLAVFAVGGGIAALSGGLLAGFIGAWSPGGWLYVETFTLFTAIIVGGMGSNLGAVVGALLVPVVFLEGTRFLPTIGSSEVMAGLQWIVIGLLAMAFLWFWPRGIVPERRSAYAPGELPSQGSHPALPLERHSS